MLLGPISLAVTVYVPGTTAVRESGALTPVHAVALLVTTLTSVLSLTAALHAAASAAHRRGRQRMSASLLLTAGVMTRAMRQFARVAAGWLLLAVAAVQILMYGLSLTQPLTEATRVQQAAGTSVAEMVGYDGAPLAPLGDVLPDSIAVIGVRGQGEGSLLSASCPDLLRLGATCGAQQAADLPPELRRVLDLLVMPPYRLQPDDSLAHTSHGLLVDSGGGPLEISTVTRTANRALPGFATVQRPGSWIGGVSGPAFAARWVLLMALPGIAMVSLTLAVGLANAVRRSAAPLVQVVALFGHARRAAGVLGLAIGVSTAALGLAAVWVGYASAIPLRGMIGPSDLPEALAVMLVLAVLLGSALAWALSVRVILGMVETLESGALKPVDLRG